MPIYTIPVVGSNGVPVVSDSRPEAVGDVCWIDSTNGATWFHSDRDGWVRVPYTDPALSGYGAFDLVAEGIANVIAVHCFADGTSSTVFAGTTADTVLSSTDDGTTWGVAYYSPQLNDILCISREHDGSHVFCGDASSPSSCYVASNLFSSVVCPVWSNGPLRSAEILPDGSCLLGTLSSGLRKVSSLSQTTSAANLSDPKLTGGSVVQVKHIDSLGLTVAARSSSAGGAIYTTTDVDGTWDTRCAIGSAYPRQIHYSPTHDVLLMGTSGTAPVYLHRSADRGVTWTPVAVGDATMVMGICEPSPGVLLAATGTSALGGAKVYMSVDGGIVWDPIATINAEVEKCLYSIHAFPSGTVVLGSSTGRIYRSTYWKK